MTRILLASLLVMFASGIVACGEATHDNAVEAQEQNIVELGGVRYRVTTFRELNPRVAPDKALYDKPMPRGDRGLFGAFLYACNETETAQEPTSDVHLEDAFGKVYRPIELEPDNAFAYRPQPIQPGACLPREDTAPDRTVGGAVLVFAVPFDALSNRPFVLQLRGSGEEVRRVQLDL